MTSLQPAYTVSELFSNKQQERYNYPQPILGLRKNVSNLELRVKVTGLKIYYHYICFYSCSRATYNLNESVT